MMGITHGNLDVCLCGDTAVCSSTYNSETEQYTLSVGEEVKICVYGSYRCITIPPEIIPNMYIKFKLSTNNFYSSIIDCGPLIYDGEAHHSLEIEHNTGIIMPNYPITISAYLYFGEDWWPGYAACEVKSFNIIPSGGEIPWLLLGIPIALGIGYYVGKRR